VQEATVFGIPHDHWGEIPKAYVALKKGVILDCDSFLTLQIVN
jgi:acyl-coenzyme A synthetase/AMP-(fatty) acid ligase